MSAQDIIEIVALMLADGLVSELVAGLLRLPRMVVLVGAGAILGPHALDALGLLALLGVVLTAVVTGAVAALAFGLPFDVGLLICAVLAPTDPAILIPLFERLRVRPKV